MKQRPERLVLVGSVLVDILVSVPHLPERGSDVLAQQAKIATGGGFNVLVGARRLGMQVLCASRVGDGPMGRQIMADLRAADIPLALATITGEDNGFDVGLIESDAERTFVTAPGTESRLQSADLRSIALQDRDVVYVSGYDLCYPVSGAAIEDWLPTLPPTCWLVLDPGPLVAEIPSRRLQRVLRRTNILSLNAREMALLTATSIATVDTQAAQAIATGMQSDSYVIVRTGASGCWLVSSQRSPIHIPAPAVHVLDTTGAGDAHVAALLARLSQGDDIVTALHIANVAAALSVTRYGPATGPTHAELEQVLTRSFDNENNIKFQG
jgi:sugar/nucleoside kinase (ribokinase family)